MKKFEAFGDYEKQWINVRYTIQILPSEVTNIKVYLLPYADILKWEVNTSHESSGATEFDKMMYGLNKLGDKEHPVKIINGEFKIDGQKIVEVYLSPKDGKINPIDFLNNKEKLFRISFNFLRDIKYNGNEEKTRKNLKNGIEILWNNTNKHKPKKEDFVFHQYLGFLDYNYLLIDRLNFEKKNKKLALKLFGNTIEKNLKQIFSNSGGGIQQKKQQIKKMFGFKL